MDKIQQWRNGLLSDAEMMGYLLDNLADLYGLMLEVQQESLRVETEKTIPSFR